MSETATATLRAEAKELGEWLARTGTEYGPKFDRYQAVVAELDRRGEWW